MFQVVLSCDFQLGLKRKAQHMKWSVLGSNLTVDKVRGEMARWWVGWPIGNARQPALVASRGPLRHTWSLVNYFP
jgi:hypothetical protein